MAINYISIRVLQHDKSDKIRIGAERVISQDQLDIAVQDTIDQYDKETEWCGGFQVACDMYYKRIARLKGGALEVIEGMYTVKEEK